MEKGGWGGGGGGNEVLAEHLNDPDAIWNFVETCW